MKNFKLILCTLLLSLLATTSVFAGAPALGTTKTGTPENGKKYYIYADTYSGGKYVNRYLYNDNGTLRTNAALDESSDNYVWTCTVTNGKYTFQNVGNPAKYLAHKILADAAYNFTLGKANATHEGTTIWSDGASRYLVTKNDGSAFDQSTDTYNQANDSWCTDYVFVEYVVPSGNTLSITTNNAGAGEILVNGVATALPYTKRENTVTLPLTITATASNPYKFLGFFDGETNKGKEIEIKNLNESVAYEARYEFGIFSADFNNLVPVRVYNNRNKGYAIKMNTASSYTDKAVNSGNGTYEENEIWYLVGSASSFKMYNKVAGTNLALKLAGTVSGSAATLAAVGTDLCLVAQADGSYGISPAANKGQSFNMHGGAGADIKLFDTTDGGSKWLFKKIDTNKALTISYNTQLEGGYEQNYKIGEIITNIDGVESKVMYEKNSSFPASRTMYLPEGAEFGISTGFVCHGWTMTINGGASIAKQTLPEGGLTVNVNIAVDENNKYQYLYYSPGPNGKPYRIPAIATTANGYVFAINDYRPCGNDIGYGEVDLVMRYSTAAGSDWDGHSWTDEIKIADGEGAAAATRGEIWKVGFGDPAIVADRENNEILVMSVCGNRTCWDGNYGEGGENENPNRMARIRIKFNEKTQQWEVGQPEEVTYDIYPLFKDENGNVHAASMFIGAGRIAQSSKIKVGTHYRIYCSVWTVTKDIRQHHNYALYSDDFGETWHLLGKLGYNNCPAKWGNEPKCEELPDGSVLLSSRKGYGRYFNVFRYTDVEKGEGAWMGEVDTDKVGNLKWGANSTNGEPLRIGNVLFQSAPTGEGRSDVSVFYKVLSNDPADYTPTKLSNDWTEIEISDEESAYSSMCILPSGDEIGFFYEEAPGGYSMVYVPLKLKEILPADVYEALSAVPPTYASEKSPVWNNIKFTATGNALYDNGTGNAVTAETDTEADAAMWNIVGTKDAFYLISKLGNYLAYDAKNNRYTTTANKSEKTILTLKENIKGSWEIMRKGANKSMSNTTGDKVAEATICGDKNQITFVDLTPKVYEPNIFSTEQEPVWFKVQFKAGGANLADQGDGKKILTESSRIAASQLWQFIGTPESFYMKSKAGNYVYFTNNCFTASSKNKTELDITKNAAEGYYEIGRTTTSSTFNQWGGAGAGKEIGEWSAGDTNNPLQFIEEPNYPKISDINNEYWYFIQFGNGEAVIEDKGAGNNVKTASINTSSNAQLWKFVGTDVENCQIVNKNGNYMVYDSNVKTSTSPDANGFKIVTTGNGNYKGMFEIRVVNNGNNSFNMNGGAGTDKDIALYTYGDSGNPLTFISFEEIQSQLSPAEFAIAESNPAAPAEKLTLWYTQPATATGVSNTWMEYSLPLGNGQFGASLFGGVARDEILFNDKTLWSGGPNEYGYYLPFGSVYIDDISGDFESSSVKNYYRDLNLKTATGTVTYENAEGVKFTRQYIASNPDKAIVSKITASEAGKLNLRITMASGKPTVNAKTTYKNGYAQFTGKLQTVSYNATLKVVAKGGITSTGADGITIEAADEVLLVLVGSTDFIGNDASHHNGRAGQLPADNMIQAEKVAEKGWDAVYAAHVADHQKFFTRVEFELDGVENNLPTNELIDAYNAASGTRNLMLEQLYYSYGRYLSIASSRGVDLPNNLQGIWNNTCTPPWHSDIHANINVQMNYWPVSAGNLAEMYEPFVNYIINEAAQPEWRTIATNKGATREDSWTLLTENNIFGGVSTFAPDALINNAWYVTHLWQHYRYTLDADYLLRAFPAMKGASLFWVDRMVLNTTDGTYECPKEYSPEHGPGQENATAHAQQIVWECIDNTIKAADKLGAVAAGLISQADYDLLLDRRAKMDRGLRTEVYDGGWGTDRIESEVNILREWKTSTYKAGEWNHRHMSHLMALFPFGQLTPADEELFEAAINSMKLRGDESTGWSMGWKINLWARALMPERSHAVLRKALKHSTSYGTDQSRGGIYYNLFDSHAPFQIDGNFGAASGVNEMLLQSHTEVIDILPALPAEWSKGYVKGLKAVGDFTVDIKWEGNQANKVVITNNQGQPCYIKCVGLSAATVTVNGAAVELGEETTHGGLPCYQIASAAGDEIVIDLSNATQNNKTALETLITETENLINECYDYYTTEAELQTTNVDGDYYVSTNAQEDAEGPITNLVDGSYDNHFHSEYSSNVGSKHYIDIKLGANNATKSFRFKYATRKAETNFPKTIEVYGYNNEDAQTLIATVTDLPVGNTSENKFYASGIIESETAYTCLRFVVTANNSGNKEAGGNPYFHMAEFDLMPRTAEYVNNYPNAVNVPVAVEKANTAIVEAEKALTATQTVTEYNASLAALQAAYDRLVAAIASGSLPVLVTTNVNRPIIYKIGIKRGDTKVLQYDLADTKMVAVADYSEGNMNQGWYFTKGSAEGKVFIHPYLAGGDVLSANSTGNSPAAVWGAVKGAETHQEWQILVVNKGNGTYNIKAGDNSNYFSNNGGVNNKMGFWSNEHDTDGGSLFTFKEVEFDGGIWYNTLNAYNSVVCTETEVKEGTTLGYYLNGAAYNSAKAEATSILAATEATENDYKEAYTTLRAAKEAMVFIAPEVGKYYRLKGKVSGKYIDAAAGVTNSKINMKSADDCDARGTVFYYAEGNKLLSYYTGTCLKDGYGIGASIANGNVVNFNPSESKNAGYFTIKTNHSSPYLYDNGNNGNNSHIDRNGSYAANNCEWTVEEVTALPVTVTAAKFATFYAPVEVTMPEGITAHTVTVNTDRPTVTLSEDVEVVSANTGVILYADVEEPTTFKLEITSTGATVESCLKGTVAKTLLTKPDGKECYVLANGDDGVGLYVAVIGTGENENGTQFYNGSHKAYLEIDANLEQGISFYGFRWDDETTEIEDVVTENVNERTIFDLAGRKIKDITTPGIYIINGKKVLVK